MRKILRPLLALALLLFLCISITNLLPLKQSVKAAPSLSTIFGLHVSGNQILNSANEVVRPLGVDRSGAEYECVSASASVFDGPSDAASVAAMVSWHINAVRVPLNEDCWLGINGFPAGPFSAAQYQQAIVDYVNLLNSYGIMPILDLHWNAPGTQQARGQQPMTDLDHAPAFWTSVANTFKNNTSVIFDLYNEPHVNDWGCWLNGSQFAKQGLCSDVNFAVAGMQMLVNSVRATGATNLLMLGGLSYSNDLSMWLQYMPTDPLHNLAASFHLYNFNGCDTVTCWNTQIAPVNAQVPVIAGEMGENDCQHSFIDTAMNWFDQQGIGYLAWAWDTYDCGGFPALITDYNGTPTQFGLGLKEHLAALAGNPTPTPQPTSTPVVTPTPSPTPQPTPTPVITLSPTPQPTPQPTPTPVITLSPTPQPTPQPTQTITPTPLPQPSPTLPPTPTPVPTTGCQVSYSVPNQWSNGFVGTINITNHNLLPIIGWTLDFSWPGNQHILGGWNAQFSQQGNQAIVQNSLYNALILSGGSTSVSFTASYSGSNPAPTQFWLNAMPCNTSGTVVANPTPTPTPQPTPTYSCAVNYTVTNQWINGFVANVTVRNTGNAPIQGWHTNFVFPGNQHILGGWKGKFDQQGSSVTISDVGTNALIAPGHTVTASFTASYSGSNPNPASFSVNNIPCG